MTASEEASGSTYELEIAGFWERIIADLIDLTILAAFFLVLGVLFRDFFFAIGPLGRVVSFMIAFVYFTFFTSASGKGQTPGKSITKIRVVTSAGGYLATSRAILRSGALLIIIIFNDWSLSIFALSPISQLILSTIVAGGILSLLYSYIFNRDTRQGPHDLLAESFVVSSDLDPYRRYAAPSMSSRHFSWAIGLFGAGTAIGLLSIIALSDNDLTNLSKALNEVDGFFIVDVSRTPSDDTLTIEAWYKEACTPQQCTAMIQGLLNGTLTNYVDIHEINTVNITIYNRMDLYFGISFDISSVTFRQVFGLSFNLSGNRSSP